MAAMPVIGCALTGAASPTAKANRIVAFLTGNPTFRAGRNGPQLVHFLGDRGFDGVLLLPAGIIGDP